MDLPWYKRTQFELRLVYQAFPAHESTREWLLNIGGIWRTKDKTDRPCFWASIYARVLGLDCGLGVFYLRKTPNGS